MEGRFSKRKYGDASKDGETPKKKKRAVGAKSKVLTFGYYSLQQLTLYMV